MICEFYSSFLNTNCNSIANQFGAMGITVLIIVLIIFGLIKLFANQKDSVPQKVAQNDTFGGKNE